MALIKCEECGHEHSQMAATCPKCGAPNTYLKRRAERASQQQREQEIERNRKKSQAALVRRAIISVAIAIGMYKIFGVMDITWVKWWWFVPVYANILLGTIYIADICRKMGRPDVYTTDGTAWDGLKKRIYWSVGPQFFAVVCVLILTLFLICGIQQ